MRISFRMLSQEPLRNISASLERLTRLRMQAGSMKKFQKPSDNPLGVMKSMGFRALLKQNGMYRTNVDTAGLYINMVDSTLLSVKERLDSAKLIALEMRSSTATAEQRAASAIEVQGIITAVTDLMNTKFHGKYIFGGHRTQTKPFQSVDDVIRYMGDDQAIRFRVGSNRLIDATVAGSRFLSLGERNASASLTMVPDINAGTQLDELNHGTGISPGRIRITNGAGVSADIDLTGATSVQDVLDQINNAVPPLDIIAGTSPSGHGLRLWYTGAGPGEITVSELDGGATAADLGILGSSTAHLLDGTDLNPLLTEDSTLAGIDSIAGVLLTRISVTIGDYSYEVDFQSPSYPTTIGDLLERIESSVPGLGASINAAGNGLVLSSDQPFTVQEVGAGTTAADLGLIGESSMYGPYSLFGTLESLERALSGNDSAILDDIIGEIEVIVNSMLEIEAEVGARGVQIDILKNQLADGRTRLEENLSMVEDVDLSEVLTRLTQAQLAYEAALQTASMVYDLSLLRFY